MANSYLPATYQNAWSYGQPMYQSYGGGQFNPQSQYQPMQQASQGSQGIKWVDGEAEAKGTPIPAGASQFAMFDINEPVIYIKSLNQMGMPNPMQKARYKLEQQEQSGNNMSNSMSRNEEPENKSEYVTKSDFEQMKNELKEMMTQNQQSKRSGRNESV